MARAIHDPLGVQGPVMFNGAEHDALFITDDQIIAYEFTELGKKEKAQKDAEKIAKILTAYVKSADGRFKSPVGWFVTANEPTAEQRGAVQLVAAREGITIHSISFKQLQGRICDGQGYLRNRDEHPFGSTGLKTSVGSIDGVLPAIEASFVGSDGRRLSLTDLADWLRAGSRIGLVGQFGVGKSHALRELYRLFRKQYLRDSVDNPLPIHINLRECFGARTPTEILRRHAEEIGFPTDRQLLSLWRSGGCVLLLDGFDELASTRQVGSLSDLGNLRWEAMGAVRSLVEQAPDGCGVAVAGRAHYFSSRRELMRGLGIESDGEVVEALDLTPEQVERAVVAAGGSGLPPWIPPRPLLLAYLLRAGLVDEIADGSVMTEGQGWRNLLSLVAEREARMVTGVSPETIESLVRAVALQARAGSDSTGPLTMPQMEAAFAGVNGRRPNEEDMQVLLRLPGLAADVNSRGEELRVFVDRALASAAYGLSLADYLMSPYTPGPLSADVSWVEAADALAIEVASDELDGLGISTGQLRNACRVRDDAGLHDAVLADAAAVLASRPDGSLDRPVLVEAVLFTELDLDGAVDVWANVQLADCVIEVLDLGGIHSADECPNIARSQIETVKGASQWPEALASVVSDTHVEHYELSPTTAGLQGSGLGPDELVAVTVLKKIYLQAGGGRKESGLSRGLSPELRGRVQGVLGRLESEGWIQRASSGGSSFYLRVPGRRPEVIEIVEQPDRFHW
jgi:hypothetical protein